MRVLLLSMPDSFEHMAPVAIRMPNGALASLAGNVDPHHDIVIADLVLAQGRVGPTIERLIRERPPDVVGLSVMTFQRATAFAVAALVRRLAPSAHIVAGGYDPTLAPDAYAPVAAIDSLVRGEGEHTFRALLRSVEGGGDLAAIPGLSFRQATAARAPSAATRCSAAPWTSSRPRAGARSTAASVRSSRCAGATSTPTPSTG